MKTLKIIFILIIATLITIIAVVGISLLVQFSSGLQKNNAGGENIDYDSIYSTAKNR